MLLSKSTATSCWAKLPRSKFELSIENYLTQNYEADALTFLGKEILSRCEDGVGIVLLQNTNSIANTETALIALFKKICSHTGVIASQNKQEDLIVPVTCKNHTKLETPNTRAFNTNQALSFHSDSPDITALLCIHNETHGGETLIASAPHIHNLLLTNHRELLGIFYHGFIYDARGETIDGAAPAYRNTVFHYGSKLTCRYYLEDYIAPGLQKLGLTPSTIETYARQKFQDLCKHPNNHISFKLSRGDILFISNNNALHARTKILEPTGESSSRLLYRIWINSPTGTELPSDAAKFRYGYHTKRT